VDTHRTIDIRITVGQDLYVGGVIGADTDAQEMPDASLARGIQRGVQRTAMGGKVEAIKVTMGIYEHMGPATSYG
jgi:hypothetical protein